MMAEETRQCDVGEKERVLKLWAFCSFSMFWRQMCAASLGLKVLPPHCYDQGEIVPFVHCAPYICVVFLEDFNFLVVYLIDHGIDFIALHCEYAHIVSSIGI